MPSYLQNKEHIFNWRKSHLDIYKEQSKKDHQKYYMTHKNKHKNKVLSNYFLNKEIKRLMNILLD